MLHNVHLLFLMIAHVKVVPEKSVSMDDSKQSVREQQHHKQSICTSYHFCLTTSDDVRQSSLDINGKVFVFEQIIGKF